MPKDEWRSARDQEIARRVRDAQLIDTEVVPLDAVARKRWPKSVNFTVEWVLLSGERGRRGFEEWDDACRVFQGLVDDHVIQGRYLGYPGRKPIAIQLASVRKRKVCRQYIHRNYRLEGNEILPKAADSNNE